MRLMIEEKHKEIYTLQYEKNVVYEEEDWNKLISCSFMAPAFCW